jgi:uridine kinase
MIKSLQDIISKLVRIKKKQKTLLVCIDGGGAAGKSTLAYKFQELNDNVTIVHMDDFYRPSDERQFIDQAQKIGGYFDWERVRSQVLIPLGLDEPGRYQRYDWNSDQLAEWHEVPVGGIVIIEGCYSMRNELSPLYDVRIWVDSSRAFRLERGVVRDGGGNREMWENVWLPAEDLYFEVQNPRVNAEIIIDGTGKVGNISQFEVNVVYENEGWENF